MTITLLYKIKEVLPDYRMSTLKNMLILVAAILEKETVCLYQLRGKIGAICDRSGIQPASHYQRALRFFNQHALSSLWIDILALGLVMLRHKADYLVLDGSSWQYGERKFHLLTLCVVYKGVAIPVFWEDLAKKGTSNFREREDLMLRAMQRLNLSGKTLLADRAYIGKQWLHFLNQNQIDFIIRLRKDVYKKDVNQAGQLRYSALEHKVKRSKKTNKVVYQDFDLEGLPLRLVMAKNQKNTQKEPVVYLLSSIQKPASVIAMTYSMRWSIECCFKQLKSAGFQLEKMNLAGEHKTRLLMALVVLAYTLSVVEGLKNYRKVAIKKYANGTAYKIVSAFRKGLDTIIAKCNNFKKFCRYFLKEVFNRIYAYRNPQAIFV